MIQINGKSLRTVCALLMLMFFSGLTPASAATSCGANNCKGPISDLVTAVFTAPSGDLLLTSPLMVSTLSCSGINGYNNVILPADHQGFDETYALILYAISVDATVTVRFTNESIDDGTHCTVYYVRLEMQ